MLLRPAIRRFRAARVTTTLFLLCATACGGRSGDQAGTWSGTLPEGVPISEPRFIPGGGTGQAVLACDSRVVALEVKGSGATARNLPTRDYLAAWIDPEGGANRFLVRTDQGPVLVEGETIRILPGWPEGASPGAAAFSPDGQSLAVGTARNGGDRKPQLLFWRLPLESWMSVWPGETGVINLLSWSGDSRSLLVSDHDNRISLYRPPKRKALYQQEVDPGAEGRITAIDLSPDGDWYLMAANAILIRAWQLPFMNAQLKAWGRVDRVFFAGNTEEVVTIDETNTAMHWLVNYGNVRADTTLVLDPVAKLGVPAGGNHFFALGSDGRVRAYSSGNLQPIGEVSGVSCAATGSVGDTVRTPVEVTPAADDTAAAKPGTR